MNFIAKTQADWWPVNKELSPTKCTTSGNIIVSEHVLLLLMAIRDTLIDQYVLLNLVKDKEHIKTLSADKDCVVRVYLGKR